ncbi:MAG TPA: hypothetical protein VJ742_12055 [Nitrososphaera sp.]|nr:hypothetical protein [Nitrososphaera sp.]
MEITSTVTFDPQHELPLLLVALKHYRTSLQELMTLPVPPRTNPSVGPFEDIQWIETRVQSLYRKVETAIANTKE